MTNEDAGVLHEAVTSTARSRVPAVQIRGWDCIEFWVGNARVTAGFLMSAFGFRCSAYAGPETGVRTKASYCSSRVIFVSS